MTMKYSFSIARKDIRLEKHDWRTTSHDGKINGYLNYSAVSKILPLPKLWSLNIRNVLNHAFFKKTPRSRKSPLMILILKNKKKKHF